MLAAGRFFHPRIRRNALLKLISEVIGRLALFALVLLAARRLDPEAFGVYNYALAVGFVLAQLADLGLQLVISREVAAGESRSAVADSPHEVPTPAQLVPAALRLKLLLSFFVGIVLLALSRSWPAAERAAILCLSLTPLLQTYLEFVGHVFRGRQNLRVEAVLLASGRLLAAAAGISVLVLGGSLIALGLSQLVVALFLTIIALELLVLDGWSTRLREIVAPGRFWPEADAARYLLREALPLGVSIFLSIAYTRLAVLLLQAGLGPAAVGQYSAAARLVEPSQIIPASLMAAVFPAFTLALRGQSGDARALGFRAGALLLVLGVAMLFGYWFIGPALVPALYGPEYAGSSTILRALALSIPFAYVNYSLTHYLVAYGRQLLIGVFTAVMLITHLLLSWALISRVGAVGPAVSTIFAEALLTALCLVALALRRRGKHPAISSLVTSDSPASSASP